MVLDLRYRPVARTSRRRRLGVIVLALSVALIATGPAEADTKKQPAPKPIRVSYAWVSTKKPTSLTVELPAGNYAVRSKGFCSSFDLSFTTKDSYDNKRKVNDLIFDGLNVKKKSKWSLRQDGGKKMDTCERVSLYPKGTSAPPISKKAREARATYRNVSKWATVGRIDRIATDRGSLEGIVRAIGLSLGGNGPADVSAMCAAAGQQKWRAGKYLALYPGTAPIAADWDALLRSAADLFANCSARTYTRDKADFDAKATLYDLDVVVTFFEAAGNANPKGRTILAFDSAVKSQSLEMTSRLLSIDDQ